MTNDIIDRRDDRPADSAPDVCVIGSGPAGLVVVADLVKRGRTVTLIESGAVDHDPQRQQLSAATITGDPIRNFNPVENRTRRLAGNANAWLVKTAGTSDREQMGLRYGLIDEHDLAERSWLPNSGWPLDFDELSPWFHQAHDRFAIGADAYEPPADARPDRLPPPFWDDFEAKWFRFGVSDRFRVELVDELKASRLCRIETDMTVVALVRTHAGGPIETARCRRADGTITDIPASIFVLACGAIENARLLLASDAASEGIGNEHDNVGRFFMDHPLYSIGHIEVAGDDDIESMAFFDLADTGTGVVHGYAAASAALCEELLATRVAFSLFPRPIDRHLDAADAAKWLRKDVASIRRDLPGLARKIAVIAKGADYFPRAVYNSLVRHRSLLPGFGRGGWSAGVDGMGFSRLEVVFQCEQPPLADSRVRLSTQTDANGSLLPDVDWRIGEQVERSVLAVQRRLAEHIEQSGIGRYVPRAGSFDELGVPSSMAHHMGTTRMSIEPEDGVVDPDCRVHTVANLYVAGSSVFPTSGFINPTLTIVALAARLADHLATTA